MINTLSLADDLDDDSDMTWAEEETIQYIAGYVAFIECETIILVKELLLETVNNQEGKNYLV